MSFSSCYCSFFKKVILDFITLNLIRIYLICLSLFSKPSLDCYRWVFKDFINKSLRNPVILFLIQTYFLFFFLIWKFKRRLSWIFHASWLRIITFIQMIHTCIWSQRNWKWLKPRWHWIQWLCLRLVGMAKYFKFIIFLLNLKIVCIWIWFKFLVLFYHVDELFFCWLLSWQF